MAAMKGVILSLAPNVRLVDISHEVAPFDVMEAAYIMLQAIPHFPESSIHLAVIDPGVGSTRRGVALSHGQRMFVGPDNGLFSLVLEGEIPSSVVELPSASASATFHGRDVFAPAAAHLANGSLLHDVGRPCDALMPLRWAVPSVDTSGIRGWVVHIDRFGNCITNISRSIVDEHCQGRSVKGYVGTAIITGLCHTYTSAEKGEPLLLFGSNNYLEVAVHCGSAATLLDIRHGAPINIVFLDEKPET